MRVLPGGWRRIDRAIVWLAACVCLLQVATLRDISARALWVPQSGAPPLPAAVVDRGAVLEVTVLDEQGAAVDRVLVRVLSIVGGRAYLAGQERTASNGRARLARLPAGEVWVIAERAGRARASSRLVLQDGARALELRLGAAESFEAVVVDPRQRPIRGVQVTLYGADPLPFRARTDERGLARFTSLGAPPYAIEVKARGFDTKLLRRLGLTDSPVFIKLERLAALEIAVKRGDGSPVAGATVVVAGSSLWPARSAATDRVGRVTVSGLPRGFYEVRAEQDELVSDSQPGLLLERGQTRELSLTLVQGRFVTVTVVDGEGEEGRPVSEADVALVEGGVSSFPRYGRTGKEGTVRLGPVGAGVATVAARAKGFVPSAPVAVAEGVAEVRVALIRGGKLTGQVVDEHDFPVEGVRLQVVGVDPAGLPIMVSSKLSDFRDDHFAFGARGATPLLPAGELGVMPVIPDVPSELGPLAVTSTARGGEPWVSGRDGSFELSPVTPGQLRVVAQHPGYVEALSEAVDLKSGAEQSVRIVLRRGGVLEGRVLEIDRSAVAGARIEVTSATGATGRITYSADDGSFAFATMPAEVMLSVARAQAPQRVVERLTIDVPPDERREVEIILPKKREPVALLVTDDRGYPLDRVEVHTSSLEPRVGLVETTFTDDAGQAVVPGAVGLPLRLVLLRRGQAPGVFEIPRAPARLELSMGPVLVAEGRVATRFGPVADAALTLQTPTGRRRGRSDDQGAFHFEGLGPSAARLLVIAPGYVPDERTVTIEGDGRRPVDLGTIELAEGGAVEGVVVDEEGEAVAGARVALGRVPTYLPLGPLPVGVTATDRQGRWRLGDLPGGKVELEAYKVGYGREAKAVEVHAGDTTRGVEVELPRDPDIDVTRPAARGSLAVTLSETVVAGQRVVVFEHVPLAGEAARAGILPGDRLVAYDGVPIRSLEHARRALNGPLGEDFVVELQRGEAERWHMRVKRERLRR